MVDGERWEGFVLRSFQGGFGMEWRKGAESWMWVEGDGRRSAFCCERGGDIEMELLCFPHGEKRRCDVGKEG